MVKALKATLIAGLLIAVMAIAIAAPATMKCPGCGMPMSKAKSAMMSVPVYVKSAKTVYYCCPGCKAGKAAQAYWKKHKKPMPV
jgi:uncharacterized protein with PIN domain